MKDDILRHRLWIKRLATTLATVCVLTMATLSLAAESLQDIIAGAQKEGPLNVTWGASTLGGTKGLAQLQWSNTGRSSGHSERNTASG